MACPHLVGLLSLLFVLETGLDLIEEKKKKQVSEMASLIKALAAQA